jgi:signal transduction histidine kinase
MTLRVRLAVAFALVAVLTAVAVALAAPAIVGRGFARMQADDASPGIGRGQGPGQGQVLGPGAGLHAQQVQQETTITIIAVAVVAAGVASLLGLAIATRTIRPLQRLEEAAAAVAHGDLQVRSGLGDRTDEIGSLGRSFDAMAADLEAAEQARRRVLQDAAHELKTPLAVIDATTTAVLDGVYDHDDRHLETIRDQARLLSRIVDDLRTVSLAEAGVLPLRREPVAVAPLLQSVARDVEARATAAGITLHVADVPALVVDADADRVRQVVAALVDNAIRHTPTGGVVRVDASLAPDGGVAIAVVDTGPGIAETDLPHVFERFYQVPGSSSEESRSNGLGLSIARSLIEAQGGKISLESREGQGTTAVLTLPAA